MPERKTEESLEIKVRKSPKEIIEAEKEKGVEHCYVKLPRRNLIEVSLKRKKGGVIVDREKIRRALQEIKKKRYTLLHTHVGERRFAAAPSNDDLRFFLTDNEIKTMFIAQKEEGKVRGYFCLRKTRRTKPYTGNLKQEKRLSSNLAVYKLCCKAEQPDWGLKDLADKYNMQFKFIPAKGYTLKKGVSELRFAKKEGLEKRLAAATVAIVLALILFIPNLFNALFLILVLLGIWFYFKFHQNL